MAELDISDIRQAERLLRDLGNDYIKEFRKDVRSIAKPIQQSIKSNITYTKSNPPLKGRAPDYEYGMRQIHYGRVAWDTDHAGGDKRPKPAKSALIQRTPQRARKKGTTSIVRVVVGSPGTVLADMAGSGNMRKSGNGGVTRNYQYMYKNGPGTRSHRINGQGYAMVRALNKVYGRNSSRFVWPAANKAGPKTRNELDKVIDKYNTVLNAKLRIMNAR